jgi:hypothetical protein
MEMNPSRYRLHENIPFGSKKIVLIVQSGQMGKFDEDGAEGERKLYDQLEVSLVEEKIGVCRFDFPDRVNRRESISDEEYGYRASRLSAVYQRIKTAHPACGITFIGMSLGANLVLEKLQSVTSPSSAVLIGLYVDEAVTVPEQVEAISLVYGSEDYIAFGENISLADLIAPAKYSQTVRSCINSTAPVETSILKGLGHSLNPMNSEAEGPIAHLVRLVGGGKSIHE